MKALLYKEFRLAMHPVCYVFIFLFPFLVLVPEYPTAVGFIYILSCYPILFLGANKGQQSNDLLYSVLMPVRKRDIVKARIFTVLIMQTVFMLLMAPLAPLAYYLHGQIGLEVPGIPLTGFVSILAIGVIGFGIADLIFFPIYYKNGKSIVMSTLLTILGFTVYLLTLTVVLPYIPACEGYLHFMADSPLWVQFLLLAGAIAVSAGLHVLTYRISSKRLEKVDL